MVILQESEARAHLFSQFRESISAFVQPDCNRDEDLADIASPAIQDMIQSMKMCSAYFRGRDIYISSSARNTLGIHNNSEPFFKLSQPVSPRDLGQKILEALESCREGVPARKYFRGVKQPPDPLLVFAGLRSWRAFEKGATYVSISMNDSEIEIIPSVPSPERGYLHRPEKEVRCRVNPEEIGNLLLEQGLRFPGS